MVAMWPTRGDVEPNRLARRKRVSRGCRSLDPGVSSRSDTSRHEFSVDPTTQCLGGEWSTVNGESPVSRFAGHQDGLSTSHPGSRGRLHAPETVAFGRSFGRACGRDGGRRLQFVARLLEIDGRIVGELPGNEDRPVAASGLVTLSEDRPDLLAGRSGGTATDNTATDVGVVDRRFKIAGRSDHIARDTVDSLRLAVGVARQEDNCRLAVGAVGACEIPQIWIGSAASMDEARGSSLLDGRLDGRKTR